MIANINNYALTGNNLVLVEDRFTGNSAMYQFEYADITGTPKLEISYRVNKNFSWVVDPDAEHTINPALTSDVIMFNNPGQWEIRIRLMPNGATGTLTQHDFIN